MKKGSRIIIKISLVSLWLFFTSFLVIHFNIFLLLLFSKQKPLSNLLSFKMGGEGE